jgi:heterodisulfide reductase subunit A
MKTGSEGHTLLFLCKCSENISKHIDFSQIKKWLKKGDKVDACITCNLLCSPKEKELFVKALKHYEPVKSVIIAGCSPKQHEKTFQALAEQAGVNMSRVQCANIREHCAYVTKDPGEATEKAQFIINAAINRSLKAEDLVKSSMKVHTDVVIIGGGIAGIEAALTLSKAGRKVSIIEKNISLGGAVIQTEEVAPHMECAPCLLAPVLSHVKDDENINVISNAEVEDILGFFGNFKVKVKKRARYVKDNCIGCEECFEVCPVEVSHDFHHHLGTRKAVYTLFAGSVPQAAAIDREYCLHFKDGSCSACVEVCPFQSIDFEAEDEALTLTAGAVIVATGFSGPGSESLNQYNYGTDDHVYTLGEFERLASSNGPTEGSIVLRNGNEPHRVVVVHCAGSMNGEGIPYCSGLCCTQACKVSALLRHARPETIIYNIHKDLVFPDPGTYRFYQQQKEAGTEFVYCADLSSIKVTPVEEKGNVIVQCQGLILHDIDMVILATGMKPAPETGKLSEMVHCPVTKEGYLQPDHGLLHATGTAIDGVYRVGCAVKPLNVPDSVATARAAAGDILSKLIPGKEIELEVMTSYIDPEKCGGCKLCISVCPFKAIVFDDEKKISIVNEAICRGCGTCAAACASGAARAKHFTDEQIFAEIEGILDA